MMLLAFQFSSDWNLENQREPVPADIIIVFLSLWPATCFKPALLSGNICTNMNLGNAFQSLGDFNKAVEYHTLALSIAKDLGDKAGEGGAYSNLGNAFDSLGDFNKAVEYYQASVNKLNDVRNFLRSRDGWKISFRNVYNPPYFGLYRVLLKQGKIKEALFAAEEGRAQALNDLLELQYASRSDQSGSRDYEEKKDDLLSCTSSNTAFLSLDNI